MREGKISRTVWNRYIRKQLHRERNEVLGTPSWTGSCSAIRGEASDAFMWTESSASGTGTRIGYYAAMKAAGDLAACGADSRGGRGLCKGGHADNRGNRRGQQSSCLSHCLCHGSRFCGKGSSSCFQTCGPKRCFSNTRQSRRRTECPPFSAG